MRFIYLLIEDNRIVGAILLNRYSVFLQIDEMGRHIRQRMHPKNIVEGIRARRIVAVPEDFANGNTDDERR